MITTRIEHPSVLEPFKLLQTQGVSVSYLPVNKEGFINAELLEKEIKPNTALVSIVHANNEIGTVQNIETLSEICRSKGVVFHTDACQSFTKVPINSATSKIDLISLNSHKIHGPRGVGALFVRKGTQISPATVGGGQEYNVRSGTVNVAGAVGFAEAVTLAGHSKNHVGHMRYLVTKLYQGICELFPSANINGPEIGADRLCNNLSVCLDGIDGDGAVKFLSKQGVACSTGSACHTGLDEPSHVLLAIGRTEIQAKNTLRMTVSRFSTEAQVKGALTALRDFSKSLK